MKTHFAALWRATALAMLAALVVANPATAALHDVPGNLKELNPPSSADSPHVLAIVGATLVDGRGGPPLSNSVVLVQSGGILAAGARDTVEIPSTAERLDASGLTLVPGLMDAHFHIERDYELPRLFLSHGVTSVRDPGQWLAVYQPIVASPVPQPRCLVAGPHLDSPPHAHPRDAFTVTNAEQARAAVNRFVDDGASHIKVYYRLPLELIRTVCDTAHARGVPVTAHLELVDADDAIRAGVDGIEHVTSFGTALAERADAEKFRHAVRADNEARRKARYELWSKLDLEHSPRVPPLIDLIVRRKIFLSPTLAVFERRAGDKNVTEAEARGYENMLKFVRLCHRAGATIVVGSHSSVPKAERGWAYQREMELLAECGLTPREILTSATSNSARFFRSDARLGTIESGKLADLVLIDGDPLANITAMRQVKRVMLNGQWVSPANTGTAGAAVFPGKKWETRAPEQLGLSSNKLAEFSALVSGRGCVVRHGYMAFTWGDQTKSSDVASAFKPVLSTLMLMAVQEGKVASVDEPIARFEPRLRSLNNGKDAAMTWRHLASQMSGYGWSEPPGAAYAYNDYAITLYYDTLTERVFGTNGTEVLRTRLAEPLGFEDTFTHDAFGPNNRPGRLALSCRDFARFGLMILRGGRWHDRQVLKPELVRLAISSPISPDVPLTRGLEAAMLPKQRSMGGGKNITPVGPGCYSFNWWLNTTNQDGQRLFADAPADAYFASGHGGKRVLAIFPSLDLIACWNDSAIEDHDQSPGNPNTRNNQALRALLAAVNVEGPRDASASTVLGIRGTQFTVNGRTTFLHGISYYGALAAPENFIHRDLDDVQAHGFNWIRVWANWRAFGADAAAVDGEGRPIAAGLQKLKQLVAECDRRGLIVDVSLSRGNGVTGPPRLQTLDAHQRAVETLVTALKPHRNWYLDLSNERNIRDKRFTSISDLKALRDAAKKLDRDLLITASHAADITRDELRDYLDVVRVDFISPHRPRHAASAGQTAAKTKEYLRWSEELGRVVPVHYQEPFRRGFTRGWNPTAADFARDLAGAREGGAAGWCFHNGDERGVEDGKPRRSFDLHEQRLFEQLDPEEMKAIRSLIR